MDIHSVENLESLMAEMRVSTMGELWVDQKELKLADLLDEMKERMLVCDFLVLSVVMLVGMMVIRSVAY